MKQLRVALVGISGVGKTTFLERLAQEVAFQHLTAGSLISAARTSESTDRDQLRLSNLDDNQQLLIKGFHLSCDQNMPFVVMDGHAVIHSATGLEVIGSEVFAALGIAAMVHLVADPKRILENRENDITRSRPHLSEQQLEEHQNCSILATAKVCEALEIPWLKATADDIGKVKCLLSEL